MYIDILHDLHLVTILEDFEKIEVEKIAVIIISQPLNELYDDMQVIICNH